MRRIEGVDPQDATVAGLERDLDRPGVTHRLGAEPTQFGADPTHRFLGLDGADRAREAGRDRARQDAEQRQDDQQFEQGESAISTHPTNGERARRRS